MKKTLCALLCLTLALAVGFGACAEENWVTPTQNIEQWDREVDFLVVGFGLAGAAAAVEAHDIDPEEEGLATETSEENETDGTEPAEEETPEGEGTETAEE